MGVSRGAIWAGVGAAAIALAVLLAVAGLSIDMSHAIRPMALVLLGVAGALARPRARSVREARLAELAECWGLLTLISTMGALASYGVARFTTGETDAALAAMDHAIGFDWVAAYRFFAARPLLARTSEYIYLSIFVTPVAVLAGLTLSGRADRARGFIAAFGLALAVSVTIFYFWPARAALTYHLGNGYPYLPANGISHIAAIAQLRAGTLQVIDLALLSGLITFPSFHAVAAILFIWAAWPLRWLRWPCLALNLAMLAVTPVQGTHYLIDVIGGIALALTVIGLLHLRLPRLWAGRLSIAPLPRPAFD
ncbi:phosphatase PAP2 family protein [Sphingomonas sp. HITSZ_GF]|uniref:phosphatase PAP2 family protein n=1 Tax=Sphingomonas sp. HITSZ_GF TaxID=3037247 RepID=UPI00240D25E0|nr:phosphatase PAP2 family protein [Sphingomonas sp. HITSZ_GF]MDG2535602.1 phosphatase PAP2 family protein [Sphingomonas sp. HITSZ_GF]